MGATNADIGVAIDDHEVLRGRGKIGAGEKFVENALFDSRSRKLTHRTARLMVVALLLSEPARLSERPIDEKIAEQRAERELHELKEHGGYRDMVGLLRTLGAISVGKSPALPVFIGPESEKAFAQELSAFVVGNANGIGKTKQAALRSALLRFFRENGHQMARAWTDRALQLPAVRAAPPESTVAMIAHGGDAKPSLQAQWREAKAGELIESIYRAEFGARYIYPTEVASFGPEFELLDRERPALTAFLELPTPTGK